MQQLIPTKSHDTRGAIEALIVLILLPIAGIAQNTVYIDQDFSTGQKPADWVLDAAGQKVAAGTCQDHKNIFSFDCQSLPPTRASKAKGFSGNIATIDLANVGGASRTADSQYCLVTDTIDTRKSANLKLTFDWQHSVPRSFGYYASKGAFQVQVWDGNQWQEVFAREDDGSGSAERFISQYSNSNLRIRFCFNTEGGYEHSNINTNGAALDNVKLTNVACPAPASVAITQVKSRTANVRWQSRNINSQQSFLVSAQGTNGQTQPTWGQSKTIRGLKANTTYQTAVREVCKNGDTSTAVQGPKFTTWCDPKPAPYFQGFDSATPEHASSPFGRRLCWSTKGQGLGDIELASIANRHEPDTPPSPPNKLRFSYSGWDPSDPKLLVSPPMKGLASYQNRLRLQVSFDDQNASLLVGVLDNPQKPQNARFVDTLKPRGPQSTNNWKTYKVNFDDTGLVQQARHVVIANQKDHSQTFIDNIRYEPIPDCQQPQNLRVDGLGVDTATLQWQSPNNASKWLVTYGARSFDPDKAGKTVSVSRTEATLSGLSSRKEYDAYVQAVCKNGDTSALSYRTTFKTYCQAFQAPYREDFDRISLEYSDNFGDRRFCWSTFNGSYYIKLSPYHEETANNSVEIEYGNNGNGPEPLLISPKFSDLATRSNGVSLDVAFESTHGVELYAGVVKNRDNPGSFTILDTLEAKPNQKYGEFKRFYVPLDDESVIKDQKHVAFTAKDSFVWTYADGVSIDNVVYEKLPFCRKPTQFGVKHVDGTTATLSWQSNGSNGQKWIVKVDTPGFDPHEAGRAVTFTNTKGTVTNLKPDTRYQAYVRTICSSSDSSSYTEAISFRTDCQTPPAVLPYQEGFDSFSGTYLEEARFCKGSAQWQFRSNDKDGRLRFDYSAGKSKQGRKAATLDSRDGHNPTMNNWILTLNMASYSNKRPYLLEFDYRSYDGPHKPKDQVWIRGDKSDSWIKVYDLSNNTGNTYQSVGPINVSRFLRQNRQAFTDNFQVRFGQQGNSYPSYHPSSGRSFDNISLTRQDLAVLAMPKPDQACGLSDEEQPSVVIKNTGVKPIPANTSLELQYQVNSQALSPESVAMKEPLAPKDSLRLTLSDPVAMDAKDTTYHMQVWLNWSGDQYQANDTMTKVLNVPDPQLTADHILDTSAMLKWQNTKNSTQTRIIWGPEGFDPATGNNSLKTSNTQHQLGGLKPGKTYEVYTQEVCANRDTGSLQGSLQFKTRTDAHDIQALGMSASAGNCEPLVNKALTLQLMNYGHDTIPAGTSLRLGYQINAKAPVDRQVKLKQPVAPTDTASLVVRPKTKFVDGRTNQVQAWAQWSQDQNATNNRTNRSFYISERPEQPSISNVSICRGEKARLSANTPAKYTDWYKTASDQPLAERSDSLTVSPKEDQTYYLQAYNHPDSCKSPSANVKVRVHDKPEVAFSPDTVCAEKPLALSGQASVNHGTISKFTWNPEKLEPKSGPEPTFQFPSAGSYKVRLQATSTKGCRDSMSALVQVRPVLDPTFTISWLNSKTVLLEAMPEADSYQWDLGDGTTTAGKLVRHTYEKPNTYQVKLEGISENKCARTYQEPLTIGLAENRQQLDLYPNPASAAQPMKVTYTLPDRQNVKLRLLTLDGQQYRSRTLSKQQAGKHTLSLTAPDQPGIYVLKVQTGDTSYKKQVVVVP
jgi:hypothetical protein